MAASIGFGTTLSVNDGASGAQVEFTMLKDFNAPVEDYEFVEATYMNMPDRSRRYVAGLISPGDVSFTLLYTKTDYARCVLLQGTQKAYVATYPDDSTHEFDMIMGKMELPVTADGIMEIKCTGRVIGSPVFTPGS
jgi:hypothetical protein